MANFESRTVSNRFAQSELIYVLDLKIFFNSFRPILVFKLFLSIVLACILLNLNAQRSFSGIVVDTKNQPIPYSHIQLTGLGLGTIGNHEGQFIVHIPEGYPLINTAKVSSIGYVTREITLEDKFQKVILQEDIIELEEVAITPIDYARELIEKAIMAIPQNYPTFEEHHIGFFRESTSWNSHDYQPIYVVESTLETHKNSYKGSIKSGTVKLLKSRSYNTNGMDSIATRIIAGPHHTHRFDVVAAKSLFFNDLNNFDFEIIDTVKYLNKNLFEVSFKHNKDSPYGKVFVLDGSYAFVKFEVMYPTNFPFSYWDRDRISFQYTTQYFMDIDSLWRFSQSEYQTYFKKNGDTLILSSNYVTTSHTQDSSEIVYLDRLQKSVSILDKTKRYDSTFWENYNIILPDSTTEALFKKQGNSPSKEERERPKIFDILDKMRTSLALVYTPISLKSHNVSFSNTEFAIDESHESQSVKAINLSSAIQYEWKKSLFIGLNSTMTLSDPSNSTLDLQLLKEINLNPNGRPITLSPSMAFGYQQLSRKIGNFESQSNFKIDGKKFDSGHTDIAIQQRGFRLLPSLSLGIEKSHRLQYFISAGYNIPIQQKTGLYFDETDQFFLRQKNAFLKNGEEGLTIQSTSNLFENSWTFSAGVYLSF